MQATPKDRRRSSRNSAAKKGIRKRPKIFASWRGYCPICDAPTRFYAQNSWYRDHLLCPICVGNSLPRERALKAVIDSVIPDWRHRIIHESSPMPRGLSALLKKECPRYIETQFFEGVKRGQSSNGVRCEDLERQTFASESFDLVVTQDVLEHVFFPHLVHREVWRTLKPGGLHCFTTPIQRNKQTTERTALILPDRTVRHLFEPEYHGNPVSEKGSLVTFLYGSDLGDRIAKWAPFEVEIRGTENRRLGIVGEFLDVVVCRKPAP